jgi:uncharacterized protein (PEP-CTERM system associated)
MMPRPHEGVFRPRPGQDVRGHGGRGRRGSRCAFLVLVAAAVSTAAPSGAQTWNFESSIGLRETATNNVNLEPTDVRRSDFVTTIAPALTVRELGDHTRVDGYVLVPVVLYARTGDENNNVYPNVNLIGDVNFFDRHLHIEGAAFVSQQFFTPFGAQPQDLASATGNRYQTTTYRVSPYVQGVVGNGITYELRNNNVWTNLSGAPINTSDSRYTEWLARVSSPAGSLIGLEANYDYTDVTFEGERLGSLQTQIGRLVPFYNVTSQLRFDATVGYEKNDGTLTNSSNTVYGLGFQWRPTDRTNVVGRWEHRYFGSSYLGTFDHRTPLSVWSVKVSRNVTTYPQSIGTLGAGASVAGFLDSLFLSTIPDADSRQQAVDQFIRDRGLPQTATGPVTLYADQIVLEQLQTATVGLFGARNSIFFTVFNVKSEPISAAGTPLPPSFSFGNDNTQTGGNMVWTNRLTQAVNLSTTLSANRTVGNGPLGGKTNQGMAEVTLSMPLSARSTGVIGARYQALSSDVSTDYNESAVYVGIRYTLK